MRSITDIALSIFRAKDQRRQLSQELTMHRFKDQKSDYSNAVAPRSDKGGGYISIDGHVAAQTLQCKHCGAHWVVRAGSGAVRGFCMKCMGPTCGDPGCNNCVPWAKRMEIIERGHNFNR